MKTLQQKEADAALEDAVTLVSKAYGVLDDSVMVDYMVIIEGRLMADDEEDTRETIGMAFRYGQARTSVAVGLCEMAKTMLLNGERVADG